ncbi:MAG: hypothetical protein JRJ14_08095 [Deltaproteobacteria bacterium]|nr:hypothetical protein [Deltaproteobacteria bacterium]
MCRGVSQGMGQEELKEIGKKEGFQSLFQDGLNKVRDGKTTLAEVIRVGKGL